MRLPATNQPPGAFAKVFVFSYDGFYQIPAAVDFANGSGEAKSGWTRGSILQLLIRPSGSTRFLGSYPLLRFSLSSTVWCSTELGGISRLAPNGIRHFRPFRLSS